MVADDVHEVTNVVAKVGTEAPRVVVKVLVSVNEHAVKCMVAVKVPEEVASGVNDTSLPLLVRLVWTHPAGACQVTL